MKARKPFTKLLGENDQCLNQNEDSVDGPNEGGRIWL